MLSVIIIVLLPGIIAYLVLSEQAVSLSEMSLLFTSFRTAFQCSVL